MKENPESRQAAIIIPARLGSRRFPRKVLARDTGKFLVEHVWEAVSGCPGVSRVVVATDSREVEAAVRSFGGEVCLTSPEHPSGTDRVAEVAAGLREERIINVQGDEPLTAARDLRLLLELFDTTCAGGEPVMTTLVAPRSDVQGFSDPNIVKAVLAPDGRALYFSRSAVPSPPLEASVDDDRPLWWQHIGIYAYRREFLLEFAGMPPTPLERRERLEQLRALENGFVVRAGVSTGRHLGIDTPEEYQEFVEGCRRGEFGEEGPGGATARRAAE